MPQQKKDGGQDEQNTRLVKKMVQENNRTRTDPFGSYTGKPIDPDEIPVQDADDLQKKDARQTHNFKGSVL